MKECAMCEIEFHEKDLVQMYIEQLGRTDNIGVVCNKCLFEICKITGLVLPEREE